MAAMPEQQSLTSETSTSWPILIVYCCTKSFGLRRNIRIGNLFHRLSHQSVEVSLHEAHQQSRLGLPASRYFQKSLLAYTHVSTALKLLHNISSGYASAPTRSS